MVYQFRWDVLWGDGHGAWILEGIQTTLKLTAFGWLIASLLGILFGAMRTAPVRVIRWVGSAYVEFFRNVPLLVWLFLWYFTAPQLLPPAGQEWLNRHGVEFWCAVAGLSVYHGARFAEVVRAGIQAIPRTQLEAAVSTGLSVREAYRYVIIPIALRLIIPPATNESLNLLKNSSLALTIGVAELTFMTRQIETYTAKAFEALTAGTLIYLFLCLLVAMIMRRVESHFRIPGLVARAERSEH